MMGSEKSRTVLVTGGSGFIGTHLVGHFLESGDNVFNIDIACPLDRRQRKNWIRQDVLHRDGLISCMREIAPTVVVHLAARTDLDEGATLKDYAVNVDGVSNVIDAVEAAGTVERLIMTSSMLVCEVGYQPTSDDDYCVSTVYGRSKVLTETITRDRDPACIWTIVRPATIWGPYHEGLKKGFFATVTRGLYLHPGGGPVIKSYGYVGNSVFQIVGLIEAEDSLVHRKTFYLSDPPRDLREWVSEVSRALVNKEVRVSPRWILWGLAYFGDLVQALGYKRFPLTSFRLRNMTTDNVVDVESIRKVVGDVPISLQQGVAETVAWLRSNEDIEDHG